MSLTTRSLRLWSQARVIVLVLTAFAMVGCSADATRFNSDPHRRDIVNSPGIPTPATSLAQPSHSNLNGSTAITVSRGDTVYAIAHRYHVPTAAIMRANNLTAPDAIQPGQYLVIPRSALSISSGTPVVNTRKLVPTESIPPTRGKGNDAMSTIHTAAPAEKALKNSRNYGKLPVVAAKAGNIRTEGKPKIVDRNIVAPLKATSGRQNARHMAELPATAPAATRLVIPGSAEKPRAARSEMRTDGTRRFDWPVRGQVIEGLDPRVDGQQNNGVNIAVPENTPIKAADDGVVIYSGNELQSFGNLVLMRHSDDYVTVYAHAKELRVKTGDQIKRGDIIGLSGQTGNVEAPQIHFEIRKGAKPLDPVPLLQDTH